MELQEKRKLILRLFFEEEMRRSLISQIFSMPRGCKRKASSTPEGGFYYAVRRGRKPGIYRSWARCSEQVIEYSNARFKRFNNEAEALAFYNDEEYVKKRRPSSEKEKGSPSKLVKLESDRLVVFTDGACKNNGYLDASGGIGIFFGDDDPRNISEEFPGKQTNQRSEMIAIIRCLEVTDPKVPLEIRTDSKFSIGSCTVWLEKLTSGTKVDYALKDLMYRVSELLKDRDVIFTYVPGHASVYGNEQADKLAVAAAERRSASN